MELLDELLQCNPTRIQSYVIRSRLFEMEGEPDRAVQDLYSASCIDSKNPLVSSSFKKLHKRCKGRVAAQTKPNQFYQNLADQLTDCSN